MKGKLRITSFLLILVLFSNFFIGCSNKKAQNKNSPLSKSEFLMGTYITISLYDNKKEEILNEAFDRIKEIENTVSINTSGTEVDLINDKAGIEPVKVSNDTFEIIRRGLYYSNLANGSFDITIGPIVKLWSIGLPEAKVPTESEIKDKLGYINYRNVELNENDKTIFLKEKGMMLDLGSIAKGYTADVIKDILISNKVTSAIIDLGGNILTVGSKLDGSDWKVGVQNPFNNRGEIIGTLSVNSKSVVTSGIYERFIEKDGVKYHHLLNPFTGYPFDNEIAGVTIISDSSMDGDALSTTIFSKGVEYGLQMIESLEGIDAIFITKDKQVYLSSGAKNLFTSTNSDFTISN